MFNVDCIFFLNLYFTNNIYILKLFKTFWICTFIYTNITFRQEFEKTSKKT